MAEINLKDFPEWVHRELKMRAALEGKTLRAFVIEILEAAVSGRKNKK